MADQVQKAFDYLHRRRLHSHSGQPLSPRQTTVAQLPYQALCCPPCCSWGAWALWMQTFGQATRQIREAITCPILMQQHDLHWLAQKRTAQGHMPLTGVEKSNFVF